jgi:hypothetical protein
MAKKKKPHESETTKRFKEEARIMYGDNAMPFLENLVKWTLEGTEPFPMPPKKKGK